VSAGGGQPELWTVRRVLDWTRGHFERQAVDAPRLTAELLLGSTLQLPRVKLYMDLDRPLLPGELAAYRELIKRRLAGEPTQYLVGHTDFYGRRFHVDPRVLIPRPETELLVEAALRGLARDAPAPVLDLCTGSGCVAVTVALERPLATVWAVDLAPDALAVARANAERLGAAERVTFLEGDLFAPLPPEARFAVVVANPPYIRSADLPGLQREVLREPTLALDGGPDGLRVLRRIIDGALRVLAPGGLLALETSDDQGAALETLLHAAGYREVALEKDLARQDRLALARAPT
jgi:release factor glutamine methyltransferase